MLQLTTSRLELRPLVRRDAEDILTLVNDWQVAHMLADFPHPCTADDLAHWFRRGYDEAAFGICQQGKLIGAVTYFDSSKKTAELGFFVGRAHWGQGFAPEAIARVIEHGFVADGVGEFRSSHFLDNAPSRRVLAKLGFQPEDRCEVWCEARQEMVPSERCRLPRAQFLSGLPVRNPPHVRTPRILRRLFWRFGAS